LRRGLEGCDSRNITVVTQGDDKAMYRRYGPCSAATSIGSQWIRSVDDPSRTETNRRAAANARAKVGLAMDLRGTVRGEVMLCRRRAPVGAG
jgi:hypothetical protein